jgi:Fe-S-cluster containining protein
MRDGAALGVLKALVRLAWAVEYALRRASPSKRGGYRLAGACGGCAKCCERPSVRAGGFTWRVPLARRLYLAWQRRINQFELVEADDETRTFVFRCGHFNWITRRCDSYASRPFLCRDYPRALLDQPWPELFPGCGYRPVARNAEAMRAALAATDLPERKREELERKMFLR